MENQRLAAHETLDLHEILSFKNVCCTKSTTFQALVSDSELTSILRDDVETSKAHIQELKQILSGVTTLQ
ncbi:MAG TPA: hypothetical protein DEF42_02915 [Desulfosporosinus sp.]|nr:hypothetical protein [Desulfosporosinus sp.]